MNIFYNLYNANKYFIPNLYVPIGYEKVDGMENLYVNEDVLPIIYSTSNVIESADYEKLEFPYNMEAMLKNIVVEEAVKSNFISKINNFSGNVFVSNNPDNVKILKNNDKYNISINKSSTIDFNIQGLGKQDILIIKFNVLNNQSCSKGDLAITVNGIKNVLTCKSWKYHNKNTEFHYVLSSNDVLENVKATFSKGDYEISNIELYKINYNDIKNVREKIDEFDFDTSKTKDNKIVGKLHVSNDGYMFVSIPYDKGFSIYLNDKKVDYEMVDNGFIGVKVKKGNYNVEIVYNAPLFREGKIISFAGIALYISFITIDQIRKKKTISEKKE